jgi:hypothetical protein
MVCLFDVEHPWTPSTPCNRGLRAKQTLGRGKMRANPNEQNMRNWEKRLQGLFDSSIILKQSERMEKE